MDQNASGAPQIHADAKIGARPNSRYNYLIGALVALVVAAAVFLTTLPAPNPLASSSTAGAKHADVAASKDVELWQPGKLPYLLRDLVRMDKRPRAEVALTRDQISVLLGLAQKLDEGSPKTKAALSAFNATLQKTLTDDQKVRLVTLSMEHPQAYSCQDLQDMIAFVQKRADQQNVAPAALPYTSAARTGNVINFLGLQYLEGSPQALTQPQARTILPYQLALVNACTEEQDLVNKLKAALTPAQQTAVAELEASHGAAGRVQGELMRPQVFVRYCQERIARDAESNANNKPPVVADLRVAVPTKFWKALKHIDETPATALSDLQCDALLKFIQSDVVPSYLTAFAELQRVTETTLTQEQMDYLAAHQKMHSERDLDLPAVTKLLQDRGGVSWNRIQIPALPAQMAPEGVPYRESAMLLLTGVLHLEGTPLALTQQQALAIEPYLKSAIVNLNRYVRGVRDVTRFLYGHQREALQTELAKSKWTDTLASNEFSAFLKSKLKR